MKLDLNVTYLVPAKVVVFHMQLRRSHASAAASTHIWMALPVSEICVWSTEQFSRYKFCFSYFFRYPRISLLFGNDAHSGDCLSHIGADEAQPVIPFYKLSVGTNCVEQDPASFAFDVHICCVDGSTTEERITGNETARADALIQVLPSHSSLLFHCEQMQPISANA